MNHHTNKLIHRWLGIDTQHEHIVFMRRDCHVCVSEGFEALTRVNVSNENKSIVASLNVLTDGSVLQPGEIGLSESACRELGVTGDESLTVTHLSPINSLSHVRSKIYGNKLDRNGFAAVVGDIVRGKYSNIHLSAFITACAGHNLDAHEITCLTQAMIDSGQRLLWDSEIVADKHCIGGLPGNRTTPIVVAIVTYCGVLMPKTSSRAITSPAGTADTMGVIAPVDLTLAQIRDVVEKEGGCIAWGGTAKLSPADDILIRVERALDIDSEGQLIASVLSKKLAAGSTSVVIDIPVGPTAKVRSVEQAEKLSNLFVTVGNDIGLRLRIVLTDGTQPIGRGIGPALEAMDVLKVLRNDPDAPRDLKERALALAGHLLELADASPEAGGYELAKSVLESGKAYNKFVAICNAQGGFSEPLRAPYSRGIPAPFSGRVALVDNRRLAKAAKLAGAPQDATAGLLYSAPLGTEVQQGQTLFTLFAGSQGQLEYALSYVESEDGKDIVRITR